MGKIDSWKDFFGKSLPQNAINDVASGFTGIGKQFIGNFLFNKQQEASSKRLMEAQAKLQREQAFLTPMIDVLGKKAAGISPSFAEGSVSVSSPSVPMPSTGTDTGKPFDPFLSAQLESLQLQNERQRIENARMREEDVTSRNAFANLAQQLGLDFLLVDDVPEGYKYDPTGQLYRNAKTGDTIPVSEVKRVAGQNRNLGSWNALERIGNTIQDIKKKGIENDIAGFQKFINDLQIKDEKVVEALKKMPEKTFGKLSEQIKTEAKKQNLYDAQAGKYKADADYTNFIKGLEENTNVKELVDDFLPPKDADNFFERLLRILAYYLLSQKMH